MADGQVDSTAPPCKVSVVIVNYNVREFLEQALRSLQRSLRTLPHEVFVVDNNSVDGSVAMVQEAFPEVILIANTANTGFAKANNQALRRARGEYLFVLNPDTIVEEETVPVLVDFMEHHLDCGAVGCRILNPDGTFALESRRAFPTPPVAFYRMTGLSRLFPNSRRFGQYNMTWLPNDRVAEVDALSGSCMMVRKGALLYSATAYSSLDRENLDAMGSQATDTLPHQDGAGLMDEGFFMYGEDLDWCYRIQQAGWRIYYTPDTRIIHYKGESTKKSDLKYVRLFYGAMLRFAEKHLKSDYPRAFLWALRTGVLLRGALSAALSGLKHRALTDLILLFTVMASLGLFRFIQTQFTFPDIFFLIIAPLFALIATATMAAMGGYQGRHPRLGAIVTGVLTAVVTLSAVSFFIKQIAFSRAVVLASLPAGILMLSAVRLLRLTRHRFRRRALIIGDAAEVLRVETALARQPRPLFELVGFIAADQHTADIQPKAPLRGSLEQLRDIVRIYQVEDVIFASASLSNKRIFALMQELADLPAQSRILAEHHNHVIGKASVNYLEGAMLLQAEEALGALRSRNARRVSDSLAALTGACLHPFVRLGRRILGPQSFCAALETRTRLWRAVLTGQMALVGYRDDGAFRPPAAWQLEQGVFAVSETLGPRLRRPPEEIEQAYWYYVRHQSALLDWIIAFRAIRAML
ncbi:MAG: glycosyltransferase [Bacteroidota bacterium]|nr:glycosyltransferase [Bacteroidota bacterium]